MLWCQPIVNIQYSVTISFSIQKQPNLSIISILLQLYYGDLRKTFKTSVDHLISIITNIFRFFINISESYCLEYKVDYGGVDVKIISWTPSASHCQFECQKDDICQFFTYNTMTGKCIFKSAMNKATISYAISGPKFCGQKKSMEFISLHMYFKITTY